jgi:8-oxo-dGTP pyrophosphatase MutT (NUDIX family)
MLKQFGTIPFIREDNGIKVVLITSASGYWIFPKGQYEEDLGKQGTAEMETFEEAGVKGTLFVHHRYRTRVCIKSGERVRLTLYPLEVETLFDQWEEQDRRERRIVSISEAKELMDSKELITCLDHFQRDFLAP